MKLFIIVNSGLETIAQQEIKELINVDAKIYGSLLEFEVSDYQQIIFLIKHLQSAKRITLSLGEFCDLEKLELLKLDFSFKDYFYNDALFKIEVDNVRGNENRLEIARKVSAQFYDCLEGLGLNLQMELKRPELIVLVHEHEGNYFLGLDLCGKEINARDYRVFTNSASFKGDFGYFFVRKSGFKVDEKLLCVFAKDGTIAIEAALYANRLPVNKDLRKFSYQKFPAFANLEKHLENEKNKNVVYAFDDSKQNFTAMRKNATLAGVQDVLETSRVGLEELDVKFKEQELDRLVIQLTTKDEDKINEIYYQASYVLKKGGTMLIIARKVLDVSVSEKFNLINEEEISRGDSIHKIWLLEKK
jgi:23S rRNA G2445 N2-methylase RlmL